MIIIFKTLLLAAGIRFATGIQQPDIQQSWIILNYFAFDG